jgi:hypothetical protein
MHPVSFAKLVEWLRWKNTSQGPEFKPQEHQQKYMALHMYINIYYLHNTLCTFLYLPWDWVCTIFTFYRALEEMNGK